MATKQKAKAASRPGRPLQMPLPGLLPDAPWRPAPISSLPSSWADAPRVSIDIETCDPQLSDMGPGVRRGGFICGVAFCVEGEQPRYLPIRHEGGDNLDADGVLGYLAEQARVFRGELVVHSADYELDYLAEEGVDFLTGPCRVADIATLDALIDEHQDAYKLDAILARRDLPLKDESLLRAAASHYGVDPKAGLWRLPARYVGAYAERDAVGPLEIYAQQREEVRIQDLDAAWRLEQDVAKVLVKMTRRGVRINQTKLQQIYDWTLTEERDCWARVKHKTGIQVAVGDAKKATVLEQVLLSIGVKVPRTDQNKPNIDKHVLGAIDHPVAAAIRRARDVSNLRTTFCESRMAYMVRGRIHPTFNPIRREDEDGNLKGTRSFRLSANHPGVQQEPARDDELGPMWRSIYVPEPGEVWCSLDYSQQEPRLTVHYADLLELPKAAIAAKRYREDPSTDFHQMMADLTGLPRKYAKNIFLGLVYGMGGAKLCRSLGLPTQRVQRKGRWVVVAGPEGQEILNQFDAEVPWARELSRRCSRRAEKAGQIRLLLGHVCHFPRDDAGNFDWTHKALNRLIQGSSAEQTKRAMVEADRAGYPLQLQVHDELDLSLSSPDQAHGLADIMRNCVPLRVPSKVDIEVGPSWGEAQKLAA